MLSDVKFRLHAQGAYALCFKWSSYPPSRPLFFMRRAACHSAVSICSTAAPGCGLLSSAYRTMKTTTPGRGRPGYNKKPRPQQRPRPQQWLQPLVEAAGGSGMRNVIMGRELCVRLVAARGFPAVAPAIAGRFGVAGSPAYRPDHNQHNNQ